MIWLHYAFICVGTSSYLFCIQSLSWLLDEDALVDSAQATQRVWVGRHVHGGLLSWDGYGWRKLQVHLTHTENTHDAN